jgi:hypothetical protein
VLEFCTTGFGFLGTNGVDREEVELLNLEKVVVGQISLAIEQLLFGRQSVMVLYYEDFGVF